MEFARGFRPAVRFGPFEADVAGRELLKWGSGVKLQEQQFQLLAAFLERPGDLITRDELHQRIWPADTFVDFERGLNKAVNRLRQALGDSIEHPRFIETVPRRGYRFIAEVAQTIGSLAVLPFESLSEDPGLEHWADGLTDELIVQIAQTARLRVISRTSAMRFKGASKSLPEIARELGVEAVVHGSMVMSEGRVRIRAQLIDPFGDRHLWAESYERELGNIVSLQFEIARHHFPGASPPDSFARPCRHEDPYRSGGVRGISERPLLPVERNGS
jgi:TolB-like protein